MFIVEFGLNWKKKQKNDWKQFQQNAKGYFEKQVLLKEKPVQVYIFCYKGNLFSTQVSAITHCITVVLKSQILAKFISFLKSNGY